MLGSFDQGKSVMDVLQRSFAIAGIQLDRGAQAQELFPSALAPHSIARFRTGRWLAVSGTRNRLQRAAAIAILDSRS